MTKLFVVIVTFNSRKYIIGCLESLKKAKVQTKIVVVDNGSTDGVGNFQFLLRPRAQDRGAVSRFQLIQNKENLGFAGGE